MANSSIYWQHIGAKQDASTAQAREASPVTVQVPKTGQQLVLERSFHQASAPASVRLTLVTESAFAAADAAVWGAGLAFVLLFRFAVRRLQAWVEVLVVSLFLATEVVLELHSPTLAADFLRAGLAGVLALAALSLAGHACRAALRRAALVESGEVIAR
jgi:hypothetical protein